MARVSTTGDLPELLNNPMEVYAGNLGYYFQILNRFATNLLNPYHNGRHMFHVAWRCYKACIFYRHVLSRRQMRNLLIAALFHDFDHLGKKCDDTLNLERAIAGLEKYILPEDRMYLKDITDIMWATFFPHKPMELTLEMQIIRDADVTQTLDPVWFQQGVYGLAAEWGVTAVDILGAQKGFLGGLRFYTEWARGLFPPEEIAAKIQEAKQLLEILERPMPVLV